MTELYQLVRPGEDFTWAFDWTGWTAGGVTIQSRQWTVTPAATLEDDTTERVRLTGVVRGSVYRLSERVVLSNGEKPQRTITVRCEAP